MEMEPLTPIENAFGKALLISNTSQWLRVVPPDLIGTTFMQANFFAAISLLFSLAPIPRSIETPNAFEFYQGFSRNRPREIAIFCGAFVALSVHAIYAISDLFDLQLFKMDQTGYTASAIVQTFTSAATCCSFWGIIKLANRVSNRVEARTPIPNAHP